MATSWYLDYGKRWFDVCCSLALLVSFSWLILLIFALYFFTGNFPILFFQQRIGWQERPFMICKFRTLLDKPELPVGSRQFQLGRLLRSAGLDELPQLWQVLTGQMSMVGPRPLPADYLALYSEEQRSRHKLRPGITGLAQVNGGKGISWKQKFEWDRQYMQACSFTLDLSIIFKTILIVLRFKQDMLAQDKPFTGN